MPPGPPIQRWERWVRNDAEKVTGRFLHWLSANRDRPFFAFLNYFDAHAFYDPPEPFDTTFDPEGRVLNLLPHEREYSEEEIQLFVNAYDGCLRYIDQQIERLVDHLRDNGLLDNTLVIITSDHGEQFGEHGLLGHANSLFRPLLHVPLVILPPGGGAWGTRVSDVVSLRDLPATILDIAGLGEEELLPGESLAPLWDSSRSGGSASPSPALAQVNRLPGSTWTEHSGPDDPWRRFPAARGDVTSMIADEMQLIVNQDGTEELYSLHEDPREERDLIDVESRATVVAQLRALLSRALGK